MVNFESRADRGRRNSTPRGGGRGGGRGHRDTPTSPTRSRATTSQAPAPQQMAPKGSPIANRLTRPAAPSGTTKTPAQKAIEVRKPPMPTSHHIAQHVVKGHVKKALGPRDLPRHTLGRTETSPLGVLLLPCDDDSAYWDRSRAKRFTHSNQGTHMHIHHLCIPIHTYMHSIPQNTAPISPPGCDTQSQQHSPHPEVKLTTPWAESFPPLSSAEDQE